MNKNTRTEEAPFDEIESRYRSHHQKVFARIKQIEINAKSKKRRTPKNAETLEFILREIELYGSIFTEGSEAKKLENPKLRDYMIEIVNKRAKDQSKEEIIADFLSLERSFIELYLHFDHCATSYNRVLDYLTDTLVKNSESATKRGRTRNKLHERDNLRLQECLSALKDRLKRELIESDLREFIKLVKRTYPEQLYIQKPRLTAEEKTLSKEDQTLILKDKIEKRGKNWSDPRIIDFYNLTTGLSGTTK